VNGFYFILFYFILRAVMGRCAAARANGRASLRQGQALETGSYGGAETGTTDACLSKWLSSLLWPLQTFPGWLAGRPVLEQWRVSSTSKAATQRPSSSSSRWSSKATNKQSSICWPCNGAMRCLLWSLAHRRQWPTQTRWHRGMVTTRHEDHPLPSCKAVVQ
jgi:hypothetical protein